MTDIRNIAIIAHVDHGKTTLVDKMLLAGNLFRQNQNAGELILDNNELERERGITILSKNVSINYKDTKINIIDTPGHSDFGGEVERVLNMADGCLLLVDAFEGPMPQTRFVLQKALQIGLKPIVVVNKVDKPNCRPEEVYEMVFDLMFDLGATEDQLDFPVVYGSAKNGWMGEDWQQPTDNINYLLDKIIEVIPAPQVLEGTPQMLITSLDYSNYTGRIAVGRVHRGEIKSGMSCTIAHRDGTMERTKIKELQTFEGMAKHLFRELRGIELEGAFPRMTWADAMKYYGSDKPDTRFGMKFVELKDAFAQAPGFAVFDDAKYIGGMAIGMNNSGKPIKRVEINGKIVKPSKEVCVGDEVSVQFGSRKITVKVLSVEEVKRKKEASEMYEILKEERVETPELNDV